MFVSVKRTECGERLVAVCGRKLVLLANPARMAARSSPSVAASTSHESRTVALGRVTLSCTQARARGAGGRIQTEACVGWTAPFTACNSSPRTVSRSTASRSRSVNAETIASAS